MENNQPQTAWEKIHLRIDDTKSSNHSLKGLTLGHESRTAWDIIGSKSSSLLPPLILLESSLPNSFKLGEQSAFGKGSSSLFSESRTLSQGLAYQPTQTLQTWKKRV